MSVLRSLTIAAGSASGLAFVVGVVYGTTAAAQAWALLFGIATGALALAHAIARRRRLLGSLKRQFAVGVAIAVGQFVIAAVAGAALMFVSPHDTLIIVVIAILAGLVAVRAAQLLAGDVLGDIEVLRDTLVAVGEGSRDPAVRVNGADELSELAGAAATTIEKLGRAESARSDLVAAVSHDLRTPLTSLRLLAEAVDDDIVDPATRSRYLHQMRRHIDVLSALIDDLFELSRLEAGDIHWTLQRVPLGELVEEAVEALRPQARAKGVAMSADVRAREPARGDPEHLQRVLFNLIQNAIRHTPAHGSVTVLAEAGAADRLEVEVGDTGDGIGDDERARVFEPFFRGGAEAARTRAGAGLGLAISRAIVEAHGGRIWLAESATGTRVRFSLPRAS
jgi:signal transduction histidine kinase